MLQLLGLSGDVHVVRCAVSAAAEVALASRSANLFDCSDVVDVDVGACICRGC